MSSSSAGEACSLPVRGFQAGLSVTDNSIERSSAFAEEVETCAELNVASFQVGLSRGYRPVAGAGLERAAVSDGDLSAPYGQLSLRFGRF